MPTRSPLGKRHEKTLPRRIAPQHVEIIWRIDIASDSLIFELHPYDLATVSLHHAPSTLVADNLEEFAKQFSVKQNGVPVVSGETGSHDRRSMV